MRTISSLTAVRALFMPAQPASRNSAAQAAVRRAKAGDAHVLDAARQEVQWPYAKLLRIS
jgi:hypothetical protein